MRILLLFLFFFVFAEALYVPILAVFVTDFVARATLTTVGIAVAVFGIVKSLVQLPVARWLDRTDGEWDDFWVLTAGSLMSTLYPFLLLLVREPLHLYLAHGFLGVGAALFMAAYYSIFAHHVDRGAEGFEWSLFSVGGLTLSDAIGAALGGILADILGFHTLFIVSGIVVGISSFLLLLLYPYIRKKPREAHMPAAALHSVFRKRR